MNLPRLPLCIGTVLLLLWSPRLPAANFNIASGDIAGLKSAINTCNSNNQDDVINLAANGTWLLSTVDSSAFSDGYSGLPPIIAEGSAPSYKVTINGNNGTIVRSNAVGIPQFRILRITNNGGQTNGLVTISNVTFTNGLLTNQGPVFAPGGGLHTSGNVILNNCTISNCSAASGGGVYNRNGTLVMNQCLVSGNTASSGVGGGLWNGDAANGDASATCTNCTFYANSNSGTAPGGTIYNFEEDDDFGHSTVRLISCTLHGGGLYNRGFNTFAKVHLVNTILADCPLGNDTNPGGGAAIISDGFNLSNGTGDGFLTSPDDQRSVNPMFDPAGLAFNGGPTRTLALTSGSPAIDRGHRFGTTSDQRGSTRPRDLPAYANAAGGDGSDIGAFEAGLDPVQGGPSFVVTTTDDHNDGVAGGTDCTLREAVLRANLLPGANTITFAPGLTGVITLLPALGGQLSITDETTITGPGARLLAISSNTQSRLFTLTAGPNKISGLTLRDGFVAGGTPGTTNSGGGIHNAAILRITDCALTGNRALGESAALGSGGHGGSGRGGAIFNAGILIVERCTFSESNSASGGFGASAPERADVEVSGGNGGAGLGGAIFNDAGAELQISNSTLTGNSAAGSAGGNSTRGGSGGMGVGAIFSQGIMVMEHCTISGNYGAGGAAGLGRLVFQDGVRGKGVGGLRAGGGTSTVSNTLCAGNTRNSGGGPDVDGTFVSFGYNLIGIGDFSTGFTGTADQTGTAAVPLDAKLGPLQNIGGGTDTMALRSGSPALDRGGNISGLTTDQRGRPRPVNMAHIANASGAAANGSDIGAFELQTVSIIVNTIADHDDGSIVNDCTLREALIASNAQVGGLGLVTFAPSMTGTIELNSPLPAVSRDLLLRGPGARVLTVRRNTGGDYRIFTISNGTFSGPGVDISGLTIANGNANFNNLPGLAGGGILNDHGSLTVTDCTLTGNVCGPFGRGGGICNYSRDGGSASLVVNRCTFSGNNGGGSGGGIFNDGSIGGRAVTAVTNSTLNFNAAGYGGGGIGNANESGGTATVTVTGSTFSQNLGGAIVNNATASGPTITLANSLFHGTFGVNFSPDPARFASLGYNLSSDAALDVNGTPYLNGPGDISNVNPLLGPLQNNGGPTDTMTPLTGSPALDRGKSFGLTTDQRGETRPWDSPALANAAGGDGSDIGAMEVRPSTPTYFVSVFREGNTMQFTVQGEPLVSYQLQYSDNLSVFSILEQKTTDALGRVAFKDPGPLPARRFYKAFRTP